MRSILGQLDTRVTRLECYHQRHHKRRRPPRQIPGPDPGLPVSLAEALAKALQAREPKADVDMLLSALIAAVRRHRATLPDSR